MTDDQLSTVMRCASALRCANQDRFLQLVAEGLRGISEIGDGVLHRCMRSVISEALRERPVIEHGVRRQPSKHSREWIRKPGRRRPTRQAGGQTG